VPAAQMEKPNECVTALWNFLEWGGLA